jgi:hypothetical protein
LRPPRNYKKSLARSRRGAKIEAESSKGKDISSKFKGGSWARYHSTFDIIEAVEGGRFPERVMMTFHPQRWTDSPVEWMRELVWQNFKNVIKKGMVSRKDAEAQRII